MSKKRILLICEYFYPDVLSLCQLYTELCLYLQNEFDITVLTSVPLKGGNKYDGKINYEGYQNINMVRVKTKPFHKSKKVSRILHTIEQFFINRKAIRLLDKQDIVFNIAQPPILGGLLGVYAKKVHKAKLINNIQDFNPEQARAVKYFSIPFLFSLLRRIDTNSCKKADVILVVGNDMVETLNERGIDDKNKIKVINNWIDDTSIYPLNKNNDKVIEFRKKYGFQNQLSIIYSGNIGLYYDLENLVKVFARFRDENIMFVFIGDGVIKNPIQQWVIENNVNNTIFIPYQEKSDLVYSLNSADIHIVCNKKGIKGVSVPSKIYGVMAVGKYVIGILEKDSEAYNLILKSECGTVVDPGNYEGIYNCINSTIKMDNTELVQKGLNGRKYLEKYLSKEKALESYKKLFYSL